MAIQKDQHRVFNFKLKSSTDQITKTIREFEELLDTINCWTPREKNELTTSLSEALANAIIHGNKTQPDKIVELKIEFFKDRVQLRIIDQGDGFDVKMVPNPLDKKNILKTNGRGIHLMTLFMDDIKFIKHRKGMEVVLTKYCSKKTCSK